MATEISYKARQNLALCFVGDDACIVPAPPLRHRKPQAAGEIARPTLRPGAGGNRYASANRQARRRADENHRPLRRVCLPAETACATAASLSASPFRPAGAGRSPIGRPGELLRSEKRRTTRHKLHGTVNAAILGRPWFRPCHAIKHRLFGDEKQRNALRSSLRSLPALRLAAQTRDMIARCRQTRNSP